MLSLRTLKTTYFCRVTTGFQGALFLLMASFTSSLIRNFLMKLKIAFIMISCQNTIYDCFQCKRLETCQKSEKKYCKVVLVGSVGKSFQIVKSYALLVMLPLISHNLKLSVNWLLFFNLCGTPDKSSTVWEWHVGEWHTSPTLQLALRRQIAHT